MDMLDYIRQIKIAFRDQYHSIPDGTYSMKINGKVDNVRIKDNRISCCNFNSAD